MDRVTLLHPCVGHAYGSAEDETAKRFSVFGWSDGLAGSGVARDEVCPLLANLVAFRVCGWQKKNIITPTQTQSNNRERVRSNVGVVFRS